MSCVNAQEVRKIHPVRTLNGWELKPFALLNSPFQEVLLLDADNVPVVDPAFLFETLSSPKRGLSSGRISTALRRRGASGA